MRGCVGSTGSIHHDIADSVDVRYIGALVRARDLGGRERGG